MRLKLVIRFIQRPFGKNQLVSSCRSLLTFCFFCFGFVLVVVGFNRDTLIGLHLARERDRERETERERERERAL